MLVSCMSQRDLTEVVHELADVSHTSDVSLCNLITQFVQRHLLLTTLTADAEWCSRLVSRWARAGWIDAADYQLVAHDYPFLDYRENEERRTDTERMLSYAQQGEDTDRIKIYPECIGRVSMPPPSEDLLLVPMMGRANVAPDKSQRCVNAETLLSILSMVFGKIGEHRIRWPGVPAIRRTSPSGGSRHPTEGYLVAINVNGLNCGWYHIRSDIPELELLKKDIDHDALEAMFFGPLRRAPCNVSAIVLMTSCVHRNMYRYRECRTFRTIHMDIGHLVVSLEMAAAAHQLQAYAHYAIDENAIEKALGLDPYLEPAIMAVAIGV